MLLEVRNLGVHFSGEEGTVKAANGVSFAVDRGEVLGIVGESGSGKSVTSLSIMKLVPDPPGRIVSGEMLFSREEGTTVDLCQASEKSMQKIRGNRIAMIFQDPMTSLNPYLRISEQLSEVLELHQGLSRAEADKRGIAMLRKVGIPAPESRYEDYPHQLSGGMRQRVMIAMALLCEPDLLIADEPTTALDVTIQAQILDLIEDRKNEAGVGVILITHDLGVVARLADRVAVMYAGRIVEQGAVTDIFANPAHPYTVGLSRSIPRLDDKYGKRLLPIAGMPPSLAKLPAGCAFAPRCPIKRPECDLEFPEERVVTAGPTPHTVRCHEHDLERVRASGEALPEADAAAEEAT